MKNQPDFPADEPLLPAHGCQCDLCRRMRQDRAAAVVMLIETTRRTFAPDVQTTASAKLGGRPSPVDPVQKV
jgi:hypothetical protein